MNAPAQTDVSSEIVRPHPQCKLCGLAETHPNVVYVVHELYRRGQTGATLAKKLEPVFGEVRVDMPSRNALMRHLEKHTTVLKGVPQVGQAAAGKGESLTDNESDYFELRALYHEFKSIFQQVREEFTSAKKDKKKTSDYGLVMLVKLASELRQMLKTLSDMRNSEKLIAVVLERHTRDLIGRATEPLGVILRDLRDRLDRGENPEVIAQRLSDLLEGELYPIFQAAGNQALEQAKQQYKLH